MDTAAKPGGTVAVNWSEKEEEYEFLSSVVDPETAFLASKKETGNEWELFKENVRPLKRGRNVGLLNHALKSHITTPNSRLSLLHNRRSHTHNFSLISLSDLQHTSNPI